ncbi:MAG: hypothetical protein ACLGHQ_01615 [Acidimicrobiia bacterium]
MPNAHEYRDAAHRLRRHARQLADDSSLVRPATDPARFAGGPLATILHSALDAHVVQVERACEQLERLAALCDARAADADAFAAPLRRHAATVLTGALGAPPPVPPAWWTGP